MWGFGLAAIILAADQATKALIHATMDPYQSVPIAGQLLRITYIRNPEAAFGLSLGSTTFHIIFSIIASLVISYYIIRLPRREYWPRITLAMILAGALGNLVDRLRFGEVVDFIQVGLSERMVWPIFNVADYGIVGDLFKVVPVFTEEVKKLKAEG